MRSFFTAALAIAVGVGCADAPAGSARTDDTSEALLSAARADGADGTGGADEGQAVDIARLGFDLGSHDAPVRIVEMSDYGCGYCRQFHQETWPVIRKEFVDAGKIEWKFLPFVTGMFKNSPYASMAAECSLEQGDGVFEAVNHRIWEDQKEWKGSAEPAAVLRRLAQDEGVDMPRFDSCIAEGRRAARVAGANSLAQRAGVRGTPTFFVVGYQPLQGALPTEAFRDLLTMVVADATKEGGR